MLFTPAALALFAAAQPAPMPEIAEAPLIEPSLLAAFLPTPRLTEDEARLLSYTYVELGYQLTELEDLDDEADGLRGRVSLGLLDFLHVFVDYANASTDVTETDSDTFSAGVGGHFAITPALDAVGEASWLYHSNDDSGFESENGWSAFAGARWMFMVWEGGGLEANGGFRWISIDNVFSDDEIGAWELGARVHFLKLFSVGAVYTFLEDDNQWVVNARVSF